MLFLIVLFLCLVFVNRDDLGLMGIAVSLIAVFGAFGICAWFDIAPGYYVAFLAMVNIVLVIKIYGGADIN